MQHCKAIICINLDILFAEELGTYVSFYKPYKPLLLSISQMNL